MHAILFTVLVLGGTGSGYGGPATQATSPTGDGYCSECDNYGGGGRVPRHMRDHAGHCFLGTPPQTCYDPSFGCYTSSRFMHRYPAFHGTYYRQAYNYRNYFDYPWHAGLHEPTSHFSYHVPGEEQVESVPAPMPEPAASRRVAPIVPAAAMPQPVFRPAVMHQYRAEVPQPAFAQPQPIAEEFPEVAAPIAAPAPAPEPVVAQRLAPIVSGSAMPKRIVLPTAPERKPVVKIGEPTPAKPLPVAVENPQPAAAPTPAGVPTPAKVPAPNSLRRLPR